MANMTDFLEDEILDLYFNGAAIDATTIHLGLLITTLPSDPTDTIIEQPIGTAAYARQTTSWALIDNTAGVVSITTDAVITFPVVTAPGYTVVGVAIFNAITAGQALFWGSVNPASLAVNDQYVIASGNITVTLQ